MGRQHFVETQTIDPERADHREAFIIAEEILTGATYAHNDGHGYRVLANAYRELLRLNRQRIEIEARLSELPRV